MNCLMMYETMLYITLLGKNLNGLRNREVFENFNFI